MLFDGTIYKYSVNPPPALYLPKMILITTPLYVLLLTAFGAIMSVVSLVKSKAKDKRAVAAAVALLLWVFPLVYAVACRTRVYNGWRHFYFIYGPIILTASYGAWFIAKIVHDRAGRPASKTSCAARYSVTAAACMVCAVMFVGIAVNNSTQYAYFNILAGNDAQDRYEMDYWMVSTKNALMELYKNEYDGQQTIKLSSEGRMNANAITKALRVMPEEIADAFEVCSSDKAQYIFINRYGLILDTDAQFDENKYEKAVSVKSYGREISAVYKLY